MALMKSETAVPTIPAEAANPPWLNEEGEVSQTYAPQPPVATEVVPQYTQQPLAAQAVNSSNVFNLNDLAQDGFEGLVFDFTSFPVISLKTEGLFADSDGQEYGKEFTCKVLQSKTLWVVKAQPVRNNKEDILYTHDRQVSTSGVLVAEKIAEWQKSGRQVEYKDYLEVLCEMVAPGTTYDGDLRMLSVSPTSKGRFSPVVAKAKAKYGNIRDVVIRVSVGDKITKVQNPFYPWAFDIAGISTQNQAA